MKKLLNYEIFGAIIVSILILNGCSAIPAKPEARSVYIVTKEPDLERCKFLGEVSGSQGNWLTGGYTSDQNLMKGARNELRNATYKLGGNTAYIQNVNNSGMYNSPGTSISTIIGNAYDCK